MGLFNEQKPSLETNFGTVLWCAPRVQQSQIQAGVLAVSQDAQSWCVLSLPTHNSSPSLKEESGKGCSQATLCMWAVCRAHRLILN